MEYFLSGVNINLYFLQQSTCFLSGRREGIKPSVSERTRDIRDFKRFLLDFSSGCKGYEHN
jgi:hypothetical protein